MSDAEYRALVDRSEKELRLKMDAHDDLWEISEADCSIDQGTGLVTFVGDEFTAVASAQIIGVYNDEDGSWLWGWDHPAVAKNMAGHARQLREFGERHGLADLTTPKLACDDTQAWEFTALACHVCGAQGKYRATARAIRCFWRSVKSRYRRALRRT